jgi:signal transduction histidine kinase
VHNERIDPAHRVQFYADEGYLADRIAAHLEAALAAGGTAVMIARAATRAAVEGVLRSRGTSTERLVSLDANAAIDELLVDGMPDPDRFHAVVGARLQGATAPVHAYGEMVDLLWADDRVDAMLALEAMWTAACRETATSLLCGYALARFRERAGSGVFDAVCGAHDSVATQSSLGHLVRHTLTLEQEIERRTLVEGRMEALLELTGDLAAARSRDAIVELLLDKGMKAVGAAAIALWATTGDQLELLGQSAMFDGATRYRRVPLATAMPLTDAVRTNSPIFLASRADYRARYPDSYERIAALVPFPELAFALLPMPNGGLCFTYDHEREFQPSDRAFKAIIARQCAIALERVQHAEHERGLREMAETSRRESELLYELTSKGNRLDGVSEFCDLAVTIVERGANCDRAAILLPDAAGKMRFRAHRGLSATYRAAVDGHSPWPPDARDPQPIVVDDTETDEAWAAYREVFRAEGIRALAFVPLVHHNKLVGKFMLYRNTPRPFAERELQFTANAAVHVAFAVERTNAEHALARAFSEERAAHLEAEEATRAREEILSVVSHDLRSPLGTIMLGASTLLQMEVSDRNRVRNTAGRIHRQAERMARLIDDLVDFAAIQTGHVALARGVHAPAAILDAASDMFGPLATERGLRFETRHADDLPPVECDPERAVQVLSNLVTNAIKVTPAGGSIAIGAERAEACDVVFFVKDSGPGIDPADMPRLFERFWRGKSSTYKGTGLGLSIARGIVDAHGGRIWAESELGKGSTFYFSLST